MLKTLTGILSAAALAVFCLGLNLNCGDKDTQDTGTDTETDSADCQKYIDSPHASPDTQSVNLETLEEKIIPLYITDALDEGLKFEINSWDGAPIKTEVIDYEELDAGTESTAGYALKITAPEFPLMPDSEYITSTFITIQASNRCGGIDLNFQLNMLYGCTPITLNIEEQGGMRYAKIIGSRYKQDTKVTIKTGQKVHVFANGDICWSKLHSNTCQGAKQQIGLTWGVWAKIGDDYYPLEEITIIEHSGTTGELSFIVPDGPRSSEIITAGDEQYCVEDYYKDSGGKGIDVNFYVE